MNTICKNDSSNVLVSFVTVLPKNLSSAQSKPQLMDSCNFLLQPLRQWLDQIEIHDPKTARFLCTLIPAQCPFERDIMLFGRKVGHIPPLCKLNPFYEQLVSLRFRALCFLADQCGEDIEQYCRS
ncbi:MAG TPA: Mo-dependent nitrogenase C-terminal domain-containing protein [Allocoleopsis sp.]